MERGRRCQSPSVAEHGHGAVQLLGCGQKAEPGIVRHDAAALCYQPSEDNAGALHLQVQRGMQRVQRGMRRSVQKGDERGASVGKFTCVCTCPTVAPATTAPKTVAPATVAPTTCASTCQAKQCSSYSEGRGAQGQVTCSCAGCVVSSRVCALPAADLAVATYCTYPTSQCQLRSSRCASSVTTGSRRGTNVGHAEVFFFLRFY